MAKRRKKLVEQLLQEQPYDNVLKSLFEGQEAEMLPCFVPGVEYLEVLNVEVLMFHFRVICLWELDAEDFISKRVVSMYPFLPTMHGTNETLLRQAIDDLTEHYKHDETRLARQLKWFGILLRRADIIPPDDKRRVQERLDMWDDLIEQDPKMKQIRAESAAKGKAEGLSVGKAEGLVEGEIKGLQNAVVKIVRGRFPSLAELAEQKVAELYEPPILYYLVEQLSAAPDESMVRFLLRPSAA